MPTWKLTIEYKGTRYQGWQEQAQGKTVQGELKSAAHELFKKDFDLGGAGRTDAGVHALSQVAHLRAVQSLPVDQIRRGLNDRLPADIHVLKVEPASERFHARHSALARYYLYQVSTRRTAFAKDYVWWVKSHLELKAMEKCGKLFVGRHDFRSFTERPNEQGSTLVVVEEVTFKRVEDLILIRIGASHFLWKMVRRLVGVIVQVGLGTLELAEVAGFLAGNAKDVGQYTAPASGLFLERVLYPGDPALPPLRPVIAVCSA